MSPIIAVLLVEDKTQLYIHINSFLGRICLFQRKNVWGMPAPACCLIKLLSEKLASLYLCPVPLNFYSVTKQMALGSSIALHFKASGLFGTCLFPSNSLGMPSNLVVKPLVVEAKRRGLTKTESAKIRNRRLRRKYNGTPTKPRLSVFCSDKQLYAMLVDDQNKRCLFYGSTLQKSIRENLSCSTAEAAECVGEELVKACIDLNINEISCYDRNGFARGERMEAFEIAISRHGFLPR